MLIAQFHPRKSAPDRRLQGAIHVRSFRHKVVSPSFLRLCPGARAVFKRKHYDHRRILPRPEGRLVAINTAILSRSGGNQGVGFAVPINLARYVMERLITDGKVTRGYLGVLIQPVTEALAKEFKLKDQEGALVGEVTAKSPAEEAGLKDGDVIVEFN